MSTHSRTFTLALAATFGLVPSLRAQDQEIEVSPRDIREVVHHRINPNEGGPHAVFGTAPTVGSTRKLRHPILYHGGPVLSTPTAYLIWYGNWAQNNGTDTAGGQAIVTDFMQHVGGSPYFEINATYVGSSNAISGNVTYGGAATVSGYPNGASLSDGDIQTIVQNAINGGLGPAGGDTNGVYFVLTSSDVTASSGFCTQYCGWHTFGTINSRDIKYSFVGNAARCITACAAQSTGPNGNAGVDGMVSVIAHELEEATTDPDLNAWYARTGAENADSCAWTFGTSYQVANGAFANVHMGTRDYLIQRNVTMRSNGQYCDMVP